MPRGLRGPDLVGGDVVKVSPPFDMSGNTALVGVTMTWEILCLLSEAVARQRDGHGFNFQFFVALSHNGGVPDQIVQASVDDHQHAFGCAVVPVADELEHCRLKVGSNCQELILNILRDCERHRLLPLQYNGGIGDSDTLLSELRELQLPHIWRIRGSRSCQETLVRPDFTGIARHD